MELPNVETKVYDRENDIVYTVLAWRRLSDNEARLAVRNYLATHKKPAKHKPITIMTIVE